jgi:hypothetical protein
MALRIAVGLVIAAVAMVMISILFTQGPSEVPKAPLSADSPIRSPAALHGTMSPNRPKGETNGTTHRSNHREATARLPQTEVAPDRELVLTSIHEAAITYDPAVLGDIVRHLGSPDPEVRAAASEGVILLGDSSGAPFLREAARKARDPAESADLAAKGDYLELPPAKLLRKQ